MTRLHFRTPSAGDGQADANNAKLEGAFLSAILAEVHRLNRFHGETADRLARCVDHVSPTLLDACHTVRGALSAGGADAATPAVGESLHRLLELDEVNVPGTVREALTTLLRLSDEIDRLRQQALCP